LRFSDRKAAKLVRNLNGSTVDMENVVNFSLNETELLEESATAKDKKDASTRAFNASGSSQGQIVGPPPVQRKAVGEQGQIPEVEKINAQVVETKESNAFEAARRVDYGERQLAESSMNEPQSKHKFKKEGSAKRVNWCVWLALIFFTIVIIRLVPRHPFRACLKSRVSKPGSKSGLDKPLLGRNSSSPTLKLNLYR